VYLLWDVARIFKQSDGLVVIPNCHKLSCRISADCIDVREINPLEDPLNWESEFLSPGRPFLISKRRSCGVAFLDVDVEEEKLSRLRVHGDKLRVSGPVDMQKGRSARCKGIVGLYALTVDFDKLSKA
jgi:hypothetical protein